ncbi:hypothetical protein [Candidatus Nitrosocosmicus sp. R]
MTPTTASLPPTIDGWNCSMITVSGLSGNILIVRSTREVPDSVGGKGSADIVIRPSLELGPRKPTVSC